MAISLLVMTSFPLFGSISQASEGVTSANSMEMLTEPETMSDSLTKVHGVVKYVDAYANGTKTDENGELMLSPLRFARVTIFQYQGPSLFVEITEEPLYTDANGYFEFEFYLSQTNGDFASPLSITYPLPIFARIYSESQYAKVMKPGLIGGTIYTHESDLVDVWEGSNTEISFNTGGHPDHEAWNILDSVTEAAEWVKARTINSDTPVGWTRSKIDVFYPISNAENPHYHGDSEEIHIPQDDGYWDHGIYHEYCHAIMDTLYCGDYPSSVYDHSFSDELTLENAINEGWTPFMGNAIGGGDRRPSDPTYTKTWASTGLEEGLGWMGLYSPAIPNDANGQDTNPVDGIIDYDRIEGSIAGILWDLYDDEYTHDGWFPYYLGNSTNPYDDDGLALGFGPIWDVMRFRTPFTIYEFWDGWFQYSGHASTNYDKHWIKAIYFNHGIDPGSSNIASAYCLPQNAPAPNLLMDIIFPGSAYSGTVSLYATHVWDQDPEDLDFLRCRFEYYADLNGNGIADDAGARVAIIGSESTSSSYDRTASWDTRSVLDGRYLLRAVVDDDMLETISTNTLSVVIDNTKPTSSVIPTAPYWRKDSFITITATASNGPSGVNNVKLYYRYRPNTGTAWPTTWTFFGTDSNGADGWSWTFGDEDNGWPSGQGHYQFHTRATDWAGNIEVAPSNPDYDAGYGYDSTAPVAPTNLSPPSGNYGYMTSMQCTWSTVTDLSGITRYQLQYDGSTVAYPSTNSYMLSVSPGSHTWRVRAEVDGAGNPGAWSPTISFNVAPAPQTGNACGTVKTYTGDTPISGASIIASSIPTLYPGFGNTIFGSGEEYINYDYTTSTDDNGGWGMNLNAATYDFTASKSGYSSQTIRATVPANGIVTINFQLSVSSNDNYPVCFVSGTGIATPGGAINIEDIRIGDIVLSLNERTGAIEQKTVLDTMSHPEYDGYLMINSRLKVTTNHPIYTTRGVLEAGNLFVGDTIDAQWR